MGVDIGGTFTDVALETGERRWSAKILTTPEAPERAAAELAEARRLSGDDRFSGLARLRARRLRGTGAEGPIVIRNDPYRRLG